MSRIVSIARYNLVRMFRERANLFFVLVFPIAIVAILGSLFGGDQAPEIGVSGTGDLVEEAVERLEATGAVQVRRIDSEDRLHSEVEDGGLILGVVVPDDAETALGDGSGLTLTVLLGPGDTASQLESVVQRAFATAGMAPSVAGQLSATSGVPRDQVDAVVSSVTEAMDPVQVTRELPGGADVADVEGFHQVAVGILVLMTFLNTLTAASSLIQSRNLGVSRRMMGTPTSVGTIVLGESAGRWGLGMFQALYILTATVLIFGVQWGHLPSAAVVLALFAAVGAGAAMLVGAVMSNDEQAAGVTVLTGLALGALGGAMLPLDLFGSAMRTVAHVTPHAWAVDALTQLGRHGGTLLDVLPEVGVLAAYAVILLSLAAWRLRVTLTRP